MVKYQIEVLGRNVDQVEVVRRNLEYVEEFTGQADDVDERLVDEPEVHIEDAKYEILVVSWKFTYMIEIWSLYELFSFIAFCFGCMAPIVCVVPFGMMLSSVLVIVSLILKVRERYLWFFFSNWATFEKLDDICCSSLYVRYTFQTCQNIDEVLSFSPQTTLQFEPGYYYVVEAYTYFIICMLVN